MKGILVTSWLSSTTVSRAQSCSVSRAAFLFVAVAVVSAVNPLYAELADDYLAKLRERGWHDTALDYLDSAADDPIISAAFRAKLGYERATTETALARAATNENKRQALFAQAASSFQRFATEQSDSPLQLSALATAGNLYLEQALYATKKARKLPAAARRQREQLQTTAREMLDQARTPLTSLLKNCEAKLKSLPKAAAIQGNGGTSLSRQQIQGKLAEAKFLLAKLSYEKARTYEPKSKAHVQMLNTASGAFGKIYQEYDDKLVGFYGRFYQGRCYQAAEDLDKALDAYWDIVDQPPIPNQDFRRLVTRSYRYRAECLLADKQYDKAIQECRAWFEESRGQELTEPDWIALSYQLAAVYEAKAANQSNSSAQKLRAEANKLYREIAKLPGEYQRDAKAKLAAIQGANNQKVEVKNFKDALDAGKLALEQMNSSKLAARLAKENNPDSVSFLNEQAKASQARARQYFEQASQLADGETTSDQLAMVRYYLSWLYWNDGRLEEAAVVGKFLAERFPENKHAPEAAELALAAYQKLYNAAKKAGQNTDYEVRKMSEMAQLLATRWPESTKAATGLNLLIDIALRNNQLADAEKLLDRLPASSRAASELRLGRTLWTRYLEATNNQDQPSDQTIELKRKSGLRLASGYKALQSKPQVTTAEAVGVLYYAQFLLADGKAKQAIKSLEDPAVGPLSLIENGSRAAERPEFVQETYKVALRAYVSAEPPQRERAKQMMAALEQAIGEAGGSQQKLINVYVSLGLQLQKQIRALTADGKANKAKAVAAAFEDLLQRVTKRAGKVNDWKTQNWIAHTNLQLGQGLQGQDAIRYYQQAESTYETLLSKAKQDPKFAPSPISVLATQKKLADCLLAQEKFALAFQQYAFILKTKPNMLELQVAAASALQQWGVAKQDTKRIDESIRGALPQANRKNLVWGWSRLAEIVDQAKRKAEKAAAAQPKQAAHVKKYNDLFFKSHYQVAQARLAAAKFEQGDKRKQQLDKALQSLKSMKRLYPKLGGPKWKTRYLELLKQIEQEK